MSSEQFRKKGIIMSKNICIIVVTTLITTVTLWAQPEEKPSREKAAVQQTGPHSDYNPAWSPDGSRILFDSNRDGNWEIYSMSTDGTDVQRLTHHESTDLHADWSPDGGWIVFRSDRDGDPELYIMSKDGSEVRQLTNNDADEDMPSWSPDGEEIVFTSNRDGDMEIYVLLLKTEDIRQLTHNQVDDTMPIWSPNGEKILFSSVGRLYTISREGGAPLRFEMETNGQIWKTSWSRDGMRIALTNVDMKNRNLDILVLDFKTHMLRRLTTFSGVDRHPSWSPDGTRLAFISTQSGRPDIFVMPVTGGAPVRLTEGSGPR